MDLTAVVTYIWNILFFLSLHIPGTILNTIEYNNARLRENPQLDTDVINAIEPIRKVALSSSTETHITATKKPRELTTTIYPIELSPSSSSKTTSSNFNLHTVSGIGIDEQVSHHQEQEETKRVDTYNATLTSSTTAANQLIESLVNNNDISGESNAPLSLLLVSTDPEYAPASHISKSMTLAYDAVAEGTRNSVKPLMQSAKDRRTLESALMQVNVTTLSNGSTEASSNEPMPYDNGNAMVINDGYGSIGGKHGDDAHTPGPTPAATSSFPIKVFNKNSITDTSHKYSVNNVLAHFPYESAAFVADAKSMYISARTTEILSSPAIKGTNVVEQHYMRGTAALVQDTGDGVHFKRNISSALTSSSDSEKTPETASSTNEITATKATVTTSSVRLPSTPTTLAATDSSITTTSLPPSLLGQKTTRRRPVATTTLIPPPTIDDYQTITSQAGTHAYLPCNVKQLVKKPISWLRVRDGHILTVDQTTFIADQRFQSIFTVNPERWSLQIKYVQLKDAGIYECQVSTEPKASAIVYLQVVEPKTELIGAPTRHVKAGSQVKLLCIISQALEPPLFINWFYNQKQIYLHNRKGWRTEIERIELPPDTTTTEATATTTTTTTTPATITSSSSVPPTTTTTSSDAGSPSLISGSEVSAMPVFTSITPQSLNDGNLLDTVSESTYHPNLIQPEAVPSILTTQPTAAAAVASTSSAAGTVTTSTLPTASVSATVDQIISTTTTTLADDDITSNPTLTAARTSITVPESVASAVDRGYMMLSTLMTVTDVKQITTASLIIPSVQKQDSGNYTCSPANSEPRTVILHVLNGEYSASAITSGVTTIKFQHNYLIMHLFAIVFTNYILPICWIHTKAYIIRRYSGG